MAAVQSFEIVLGTFNIESSLLKVVHRNGSLNYIIINLYFLLASPYRLNNLKEIRCYEFFPELLVIQIISV